MTSAQVVPPAAPCHTSCPAAGPIASLRLQQEATDADGFVTITVLAQNLAGKQVVVPPASRPYIEVGLEPPLVALDGRRRRQAFGGRASFRLRLERDVAVPEGLRLRAVVADLAGEPSGELTVAWPRPRGWVPEPILPPPPPIPSAASFRPIGQVRVGQPWRVPIAVALLDAYGRTCPTPSSPPLMVSLRPGRLAAGGAEQRFGSVIAERAAHAGVATFDQIVAPTAPGHYVLQAQVTRRRQDNTVLPNRRRRAASQLDPLMEEFGALSTVSSPFQVLAEP